jgi:hypothetical protein
MALPDDFRKQQGSLFSLSITVSGIAPRHGTLRAPTFLVCRWNACDGDRTHTGTVLFACHRRLSAKAEQLQLPYRLCYRGGYHHVSYGQASNYALFADTFAFGMCERFIRCIPSTDGCCDKRKSGICCRFRCTNSHSWCKPFFLCGFTNADHDESAWNCAASR